MTSKIGVYVKLPSQLVARLRATANQSVTVERALMAYLDAIPSPQLDATPPPQLDATPSPQLNGNGLKQLRRILEAHHRQPDAATLARYADTVNAGLAAGEPPVVRIPAEEAADGTEQELHITASGEGRA